MNGNAKIATAASALVVAGLVALAAPAVAGIAGAVGPAADRIAELTAPSDQPTPLSWKGGLTETQYGYVDRPAPGWEADIASRSTEPTPTSYDPQAERARAVGCDEFATVGGYGKPSGVTTWEKASPRPDMGAREYASGPVTFGEDGGVETYTVQPGDAGMAIGERFCVDWVTLFFANDVYPSWSVQPGDVLLINP